MYIYTDYLVICHGLPVRSRILLLTCAGNFVKVSVIHIRYASCACVKGLMAASSSGGEISVIGLCSTFILCVSAKVVWFRSNKKELFAADFKFQLLFFVFCCKPIIYIYILHACMFFLQSLVKERASVHVPYLSTCVSRFLSYSLALSSRRTFMRAFQNYHLIQYLILDSGNNFSLQVNATYSRTII